MNWDRIEGNWKQLSGKVRQQWGKLTDDDLDVIDGRREELAGRIQEVYGVSKTCRPKVRVMVAVMTCGSRMVTSDSSTTVIAFAAARALRGLISAAAPSPAPPANIVLRPKLLRILHPSLRGEQRSRERAQSETGRSACFRQEDRP